MMRKWLIGGVVAIAALAIGVLVLGPRLSNTAVKATVEAALSALPPDLKARHGTIDYASSNDRLTLDTFGITLNDSKGNPVDFAFEGIEMDALKPTAFDKVFNPARYDANARTADRLDLADRLAARKLVVTRGGETIVYSDIEVLKPAARQFIAPPPASAAEFAALDAARVEDMIKAVAWSSAKSGPIAFTSTEPKGTAAMASLALGAFDGQRLESVRMNGIAAAPDGGSLAVDAIAVDNLDVGALAALKNGDRPEDAAAMIAAIAYDKASISKLSFSDPADGSTGKIGSLELAGVGGAKVASFALNDFAVKTKDGGVDLGSLKMTGLDASRLQAELAAGKEDMTSGAVRLSEYDMANLAVNLPNGGPVTIARVTLNGITYAGDVPTGGTLAIDDVKVPLSAMETDEERKPFVGMGYTELVFDAAADYSYDPAQKLVDMKKIELSMADGGTLAMNAKVDGIEPDAFGGNPMAAMAASAGARIQALEISFTDNSLVKRAIDYSAKDQGTTPAAIVADARRSLEAEIGNARGNAAKDAIRSIVAFLENPGRLVLRIAPKEPMGMTEMQALGDDPDVIAKALNLSVTAEPH